MALLFDFYGELLTEKQRMLFDQYYNQDYSLGEIAENEGISRQGVHDAIARAEQSLRNFEARTGCVARHRRTQAALEQIQTEVEQLQQNTDPSVRAVAAQILSTMETIKE